MWDDCGYLVESLVCDSWNLMLRSTIKSFIRHDGYAVIANLVLVIDNDSYLH